MKTTKWIAILLLLPVIAVAASGNIFSVDEQITVTLPAGARDVRIYDIDGNPTDFKREGEQLRFAELLTGYYYLDYITADRRAVHSGIAVLPSSVDELDDRCPVAIDAALFYPFFLRQSGRIKFDYQPDDVVGLLRKANLGYARERIYWKGFDYPSGANVNSLVDELIRAYARHGIKVVPSIYATPSVAQWPIELSPKGQDKPPLDLFLFHDYIQTVAQRFGPTVAGIESWNEPEGIGGGMMNFEIAAIQKAAMLGAIAARPNIVCFMGNGSVHHGEGLIANQLNDYQNVFCVHSHFSLSETAIGCEQRMAAGQSLPKWLTEASTGSFPIDSGTADLSREQARKQALDIPKLYAQLLQAGADKVFYFFLFRHIEENGRSFGLLNHADLTSRPGIVTLATLARFFQHFHSIKPLLQLAHGVVGYAVNVTYERRPYTISLLWSTGSSSYRIRDIEFAYDAWGRKIDLSRGVITVTDVPVYLFAPAKAPISPRPAPAALPKAASPVVLLPEFPDNIKNVTADTVQFPFHEECTYQLSVYNFSAEEIKGFVTANLADGTATVEAGKLLTVPPHSRIRLPLKINIGSAPVQQLTLNGNFGTAGQSIAVLNVVPFRNKVLPGDTEIKIPHWQQSENWKKSIIDGSAMTISATSGRMGFVYDFQAAQNRVINHVWASPTLSLNRSDLPSSRPDAIAFEIKLIRGEKIQNMGINLVEADGSTYFASIPFKLDELRKGQRFVVSLSAMTNPPFRKRDVNGKLDFDEIRSLEFPIWTPPNEKIQLELRSLSWVNFSNKN